MTQRARRLLSLVIASITLSPHAQVRAESAETILAHFAGEPSVRDCQRAAARTAEVEPERVRSWLGRVRKAALLPGLKLRVGHGVYGYLSQSADAISYLPTGSDTFRVEAEATWSLDRLVFDHNEIGLGRESQRIAARRELLLTEVAQLYFARRRLQVEALSAAAEPIENQIERHLTIDELTAVLDGLTNGALSSQRPKRGAP